MTHYLAGSACHTLWVNILSMLTDWSAKAPYVTVLMVLMFTHEYPHYINTKSCSDITATTRWDTWSETLAPGVLHLRIIHICYAGSGETESNAKP